IGADPAYVNHVAGDLRLSAGSPSIDTGNDYVDFDPLAVGFQPLPATDLDGKCRMVDGNFDGEAVVDMGAYEYQGN
ncbi:MAG: hypothetical protein JSU83_07040, partial [Deltaproteobacteria bacterium]